MRPTTLICVMTLALAGAGAFGLAQAQQHHHHAGGGMHPSGSAAATTLPAHGTDKRELVRFPEMMTEHMLANMRDHLAALQEIQDHLGMGHPDIAAKIAENRLGMSSLPAHGAHDVSRFMPQGMQQAGTAMHKAASQFALVAQESAVTGDMKPVFSALAQVTAACVTCHAGYRAR